MDMAGGNPSRYELRYKKIILVDEATRQAQMMPAREPPAGIAVLT
ncbi:hypothetical protein ACFSKM_17145 [Ancylobacter dichloromethanicus]